MRMPDTLPSVQNKLLGVDVSGQINYSENPAFTTLSLANSSNTNKITLDFAGTTDLTLTLPAALATRNNSLLVMSAAGEISASSFVLSDFAQKSAVNTFTQLNSFQGQLESNVVGVMNAAMTNKVSMKFTGTSNYDLTLPAALPASTSVLSMDSAGNFVASRDPELETLKFANATNHATLDFKGTSNFSYSLPPAAPVSNDSLMTMSTTGEMKASTTVLTNVATLNGNNVFTNPLQTTSLKLNSGLGVATLSYGGTSTFNLLLPTDLPNPLATGARILTTSTTGQIDYLTFETEDIMRKSQTNVVSGELHLINELKFDEGPDVAQIKFASLAAPDDFANITGTGYTIKLPETDLPSVTSFLKITSAGKLHYGTIASAFNDLELDSLALKDQSTPTTNKITFVAPALVPSSYNITLPADPPAEHEVKSEASYGTQITAKSNSVLSSNANGNAQWTLMESICPIGVIFPYAARPYLQGDPTAVINDASGNSQPNIVAPPGWIFCWGQSCSRALYPNLFALFGTTYGTGSNGNLTFNVPDYRGTFLRGLDNGRGLDTNPNRTVGSYQVDQIKSHAHGYSDQQPHQQRDLAVPGVFDDRQYTNYNEVTANLTTGATGGAETNPRNYAVEYIIRTGRQELINQYNTDYDAYSMQLL
jgi:microcystin-dependent protein